MTTAAQASPDTSHHLEFKLCAFGKGKVLLNALAKKSEFQKLRALFVWCPGTLRSWRWNAPHDIHFRFTQKSNFFFGRVVRQSSLSAVNPPHKKLRFCFCEKATRQKIELFYAGGGSQKLRCPSRKKSRASTLIGQQGAIRIFFQKGMGP